jgi:hypothetical protein
MHKLLWLGFVLAVGCNAVLNNDPVRLQEPQEGQPDPVSEADGGARRDGRTPPPDDLDADTNVPDAIADEVDAGPAACTDPVTCPCKAGDPPITEACGDCGKKSYACMNGKWRSSEGCSCTTITELGGACGNGGNLERTCGADCKWGEFRCGEGGDGGSDAGNCPAQDPEIEQRACNACGLGMQKRVRTWSTTSCAYGAWSDWSACEGATGACVPAQVETQEQSCGSCGAGTQQRTRTCDSSCAWSGWGGWSECSGSAQCAPGQTSSESRGCGVCGAGAQTRKRTCSDQCSWSDWEAWGECAGGATECTPGQVEVGFQACGACSGGTQQRTRTCTDGCTWGAWSGYGLCSGVAQCMPGQSETRTQRCGPCNSGTQTSTRTCSSECAWEAWTAFGACGNVTAACAPGQTHSEKTACGACNTGLQTHTQTCSDSCEWSAYGDYTACTGVTATCTPGAKKTSRRVCAACGIGVAIDTQTCSSSCGWGAVVPGTCQTPNNYCNPAANNGYVCRGKGRREWCFIRGTDEQCTYGEPDSESCNDTDCPDCY